MTKKLELYLPRTIDECENGHIDLDAPGYNNDDDCYIDLHIREGYDDDMLQERTNLFWKNLTRMEAFRNLAKYTKVISFAFLELDDWEPFLKALQECGANIEKLNLSCCELTEQGALLLGDILKTTPPAAAAARLSSNDDGDNKWEFCIKSLYIRKLEGSVAWTSGFLQNKTITHLDVQLVPLPYTTIQFIQRSRQLRHAEICGLANEEGEREEEPIDFDVDTHNQNESLEISRY